MMKTNLKTCCRVFVSSNTIISKVFGYPNSLQNSLGLTFQNELCVLQLSNKLQHYLVKLEMFKAKV